VTPKQTIVISEDLTSQDEEKLISCLSRNKDAFAWSTLDLVGVNRTIIEHSLGIDPSVRPKKQWLRKMSDEKMEAAKAEVHRLLEAVPNHLRHGIAQAAPLLRGVQGAGHLGQGLGELFRNPEASV
jgi:hypothetical protein